MRIEEKLNEGKTASADKGLLGFYSHLWKTASKETPETSNKPEDEPSAPSGSSRALAEQQLERIEAQEEQ